MTSQHHVVDIIIDDDDDQDDIDDDRGHAPIPNEVYTLDDSHDNDSNHGWWSEINDGVELSPSTQPPPAPFPKLLAPSVTAPFRSVTADEMNEFVARRGNATANDSNELDILITYLHGQKALYEYASNYTKYKHTFVMMPCIALSALLTFISPLATCSSKYGAVTYICSAGITCALAVIQFTNWESTANSYKQTSLQYEKLKMSLEIANNTLLFIDQKKERTQMVADKVHEFEHVIAEINDRHHHTLTIPVNIKQLFPFIAYVNIFSFMKRIEMYKHQKINSLRDIKNEIRYIFYKWRKRRVQHFYNQNLERESIDSADIRDGGDDDDDDHDHDRSDPPSQRTITSSPFILLPNHPYFSSAEQDHAPPPPPHHPPIFLPPLRSKQIASTKKTNACCDSTPKKTSSWKPSSSSETHTNSSMKYSCAKSNTPKRNLAGSSCSCVEPTTHTAAPSNSHKIPSSTNTCSPYTPYKPLLGACGARGACGAYVPAALFLITTTSLTFVVMACFASLAAPSYCAVSRAYRVGTGEREWRIGVTHDEEEEDGNNHRSTVVRTQNSRCMTMPRPNVQHRVQ